MHSVVEGRAVGEQTMPSPIDVGVGMGNAQKRQVHDVMMRMLK